MHTEVFSSDSSWCLQVICTFADMWFIFEVYWKDQDQMWQNVNNQWIMVKGGPYPCTTVSIFYSLK